MAERIEVYKGVVPISLGGDALGGAVNIVTKQNMRKYIDASYSIGSFNTHKASFSGRFANKMATYSILMPLGTMLRTITKSMLSLSIKLELESSCLQENTNVSTMGINRELLFLKQELKTSLLPITY